LERHRCAFAGVARLADLSGPRRRDVAVPVRYSKSGGGAAERGR